jgi:regulator of protease activity HflC (stomatin/prohibitin superfamily)
MQGGPSPTPLRVLEPPLSLDPTTPPALASPEASSPPAPTDDRPQGRVAEVLRRLPARTWWRRAFGVTLAGCVVLGVVALNPIAGIEPGELGIRTNRFTGGVVQLEEGWALTVPGIHRLRRFPMRDQVYRPSQSQRAGDAAPFQSVEGLSLGVDVTVRYAFDVARVRTAARTLPEDVVHALVEPLTDGVLHQVFSTHTVREIFSSKRAEIQGELEAVLGPKLAAEGVTLRSVFLGNVDLPAEYRAGLERLLEEELGVEKMRYTLDLHEQGVKDAGFLADAEKVRREKEAEASGNMEIIAAKARAEAMKHVLPFKEKEIEQRRLEAEANKITRLKQAEAEAESRRIESGGEADARRTLAAADAYRLEVTGKAASEQLGRDAALITANPLLIQKTLADKLSDKISVIIAPPQVGGFFAQGLLGSSTPAVAVARKDQPEPEPQASATGAEGSGE